MSTILLVDDNPMNLDMLSRRLTRRGYTVVTAVDGAEGVAQALVTVPDLILMDMALPVIAGDEAVRLIRRSPTLATIPIIALTAHTGADEVAAMRAAGCDEVEAKPVELPRLLDKMTALLAQEGDVHGR